MVAAFAGLGYVVGKVGYSFELGENPSFLIEENSVTLLNNPLTISGTAIIIGNTVSYGSDFSPNVNQDTSDSGFMYNVGLYEQGNTYQCEVLGPLFFPTYGSGFIGGSTHDSNPLEQEAHRYGSGARSPF